MKKKTSKTVVKNPVKKRISTKKTSIKVKKPSTPKKSVQKSAKKPIKSKSPVKKTPVKKAVPPKKTPVKPKITIIKPVSGQSEPPVQLQVQISHRRPLLIIPK
jgi:hypothetical protein